MTNKQSIEYKLLEQDYENLVAKFIQLQIRIKQMEGNNGEASENNSGTERIRNYKTTARRPRAPYGVSRMWR